MNDKYEASGTESYHRIESTHALCCAETGRVMAVFYDEYDLEDVIDLLNKKPSADVESLPTPQRISISLLDDFSKGQAESIAAEVYQPLYNLLKDKQGN